MRLGTTVREPAYEFQFQKKERNEDQGSIFDF